MTNKQTRAINTHTHMINIGDGSVRPIFLNMFNFI